MRIIGGKFRSRRIFSDGGKNENCIKGRLSGFRPTTDRAKETLFNVLNNILDFDSVKCLDIFAGSGSLGFEALSRGASETVFVESSKKQCDMISKTAAELGCAGNTVIVNSDVLKYLVENEGTFFDLIFADPPYDYRTYNDLAAMVMGLKFSVFVMEYSDQSGFMYNVNDFDVIDKSVGFTKFKIFITKE